MRRFTRTQRSKSASRVQTHFETLEARWLLTCLSGQADDGTVFIEGPQYAADVLVVDDGGGNLRVSCQRLGIDLPQRFLVFEDATALDVVLGPQGDRFQYLSENDVNEALASVEAALGGGADVGQLRIQLDGRVDGERAFVFNVHGDEGDDDLTVDVTTLTRSDDDTQPVLSGEIHGSAGQDAMTFITRAASGGLELTSREATASTAEPDCLIWDLVDGSTGEVNAQVMGSEVDEVMEARTDERGIGRSDFDITMDGRGGVNALNAYLVLEGASQGSVAMHNWADSELQVEGDLINLESNAHSDLGSHPTTLTIQVVGHTYGYSVIGSDQRDVVNVDIGAHQLSELDIDIETNGGNDQVVISQERFFSDARQRDSVESVEVSMGEGDDSATILALLEGPVDSEQALSFILHGDDGDDDLTVDVTTLTRSDDDSRPVLSGEIHGSAGQDAMTFITRTASGGLELTSREATASVAEPDCMIWDLIDGSTGEVQAQVMGSEVDERMGVRTGKGGIGRSDFDITMDGRGGVNALNAHMTLVSETQGMVYMRNGAVTELDVEGVDNPLERLALVATMQRQSGSATAAVGGVLFGYEFTVAHQDIGHPVVELDASGFDGVKFEMNTDGPISLEADVVIPGLLSSRMTANESSAASDGARLAYSHSVNDTDGDGQPDFLDLDADSDGISEAEVSATFGGRFLTEIGLRSEIEMRDVRVSRVDVEMIDPNGQLTRARASVNDRGSREVPYVNYSYLANWDEASQMHLDVVGTGEVDVQVDSAAEQVGLEASVRGFDQTDVVARHNVDEEVATLARVAATNPADRSQPLLINVLVNNANIDNWEIHVPEHESSSVDFSHRGTDSVSLMVQHDGVGTVELPEFSAEDSAGPARVGTERRGPIDRLIVIKMEQLCVKGESKVQLVGFGNFVTTRHIQGMEIERGASYIETIHMDTSTTSRTNKPLLIIAEDIEGEALSTFESNIIGDGGANLIDMRWHDVVNHGAIRQTVDTGDGPDAVRYEMNNFVNFGSAAFSTLLGPGADRFESSASSVYVGPGATFTERISGGRGPDYISVDNLLAIDGSYAFVADGGGDDDVIDIVQEISRGPIPRGGPRPIPNIYLRALGDLGDDDLTMFLIAPDLDDEWVDALIDGGRGIDVCGGNVRSVNCEL